jgi:hypothetical protein
MQVEMESRRQEARLYQTQRGRGPRGWERRDCAFQGTVRKRSRRTSDPRRRSFRSSAMRGWDVGWLGLRRGGRMVFFVWDVDIVG